LGDRLALAPGYVPSSSSSSVTAARASSSSSVSFIVPGRPATKGSTVSFVHRGRVVTKTDATALPAWTRTVQVLAQAAGVRVLPKGTAVAVAVRYEFARPARGRQAYPCTRPDCDKLARALLDALTGIAYADDGQVVLLAISKIYGPQTLMRVEVGAC